MNSSHLEPVETSVLGRFCGRYWVRTSDLSRVKRALYH